MKNESRVIGRKVSRIDATEKVTGSFKYPSDLTMPGLLHAVVLRSPHGHAKIEEIESSAAESLEGVIKVFTAKDVSQELFGEIVKDTPIFAREKVRYYGEPVACVLADSEDVARNAIKKIKVKYKTLPEVFDPSEAMKEEAPLIHDNYPGNIAVEKKAERGDVEKAFAECAVIEKDTFTLPYVHQVPLEPNGCIAFVDERGQLNLYTPNQSPAWLRSRLAELFNLDLFQVRVIQIQGGGGFGGKCPLTIEQICVALALDIKRPVRLVNNREEDFYATWGRVPMKIELELGADKSGKLLAKRSRVIADNGAYSNIAPGVLSTALTRIDSLYRLKNVENIGWLVYTNKIPTGMFRGFGNPQITFTVETLIDRLAARLNIDPGEMRKRNAPCAGDVSVHGWNLKSCGLTECIAICMEESNWNWKGPGKMEKGKKVYRGQGLACCIHVAGNRGVYPSFDGSAAEVRIGPDGGVKVLSGEGEIGCGANTTFAQIAAEILGVEMERIQVPEVDSCYSPFGLGAYASRVTAIGGNAVKNAAENALEQLKEEAACLMGLNKEKIIYEEGRFKSGDKTLTFEEVCREGCYSKGGTTIVGKGTYIPQDVTIADKETLYGNISPSYSFGAQLVDLEIDVETGKVKILDFLAVQDLGRVLNPLGAEGQLEGGVIMGIGYALSEELVLGEKGEVINPRYRDYKIPLAIDSPQVRVKFVETNDPVGPFGAKSVGEPALVPTAPAIANAIFNAVGIKVNSLPITPEKMKMELQKKIRELEEKE